MENDIPMKTTTLTEDSEAICLKIFAIFFSLHEGITNSQFSFWLHTEMLQIHYLVFGSILKCCREKLNLFQFCLLSMEESWDLWLWHSLKAFIAFQLDPKPRTSSLPCKHSDSWATGPHPWQNGLYSRRLIFRKVIFCIAVCTLWSGIYLHVIMSINNWS